MVCSLGALLRPTYLSFPQFAAMPWKQSTWHWSHMGLLCEAALHRASGWPVLSGQPRPCAAMHSLSLSRSRSMVGGPVTATTADLI